MPLFKFTIFTPTYNRANTLERVYKSLCNQDPKFFEWLVVDDGSTDDTIFLLNKLSLISKFPIRIFKQSHGGKHRAHNNAIKIARGELMIVLDSDDELSPDALSLISSEWTSIPLKLKNKFAGILGGSVRQKDFYEINRQPKKSIDGKLFELIYSRTINGEKLPCYRLKILKEFPFPERPNCNSAIPESTVWLKIGEKYMVRCIDSNVRIYHRNLSDPISLMNSYKKPNSNSWGLMQSCITEINLSPNYFPRFFLVFLKNSINTTRYALHSKSNIFNLIFESPLAKAIYLLGIPLGFFMWFYDFIIICIRK